MYALSIVFLVTTGFYVNSPWTGTMIEGSAAFPMATMRYIHFIAAYVFSAAVLLRLYLYIFGNAQERLWGMMPINRRNIKNLIMTLKQYTYLSDKHDDRLGHNVFAGIYYFVTLIFAILMIASGFFMLYPEVPFWQGWGLALFGSQQSARYLHHITMWWFIFFPVLHVYFCIWNDCEKPEGMISAMFNGAKFKQKT
jgi:Ni/Fe-hydrogenase 1 B-type cytochrome subunit